MRLTVPYVTISVFCLIVGATEAKDPGVHKDRSAILSALHKHEVLDKNR